MGVLNLIIYLGLFVCGFIHCSVLPVEKCTLTDKTCMITATQKMTPIFVAGMPEYDVGVMDPLALNDVKFDISGFQFTLTDGTLKGLKNSIIDEAEWDLEKKIFKLTAHADISIKGHYTAAGNILLLPISGDGQCKMKFKNMKISASLNFDMVKKDDKDHIKLTSYNYDFDVKDNANYNLTNLFQGNKELSDAMLTFLNENWKEISVEFGRPVTDVGVKQIVKNINNFFGKLPIKEISNF